MYRFDERAGSKHIIPFENAAADRQADMLDAFCEPLSSREASKVAACTSY